MSEEVLNKRYQIRTYLDHAYRSLDAAALNLDNGFYATTINRAYYAIVDKHSASLTDTERRALDTLVQRLYARHDGQIQSVILFGSKARGDAGPDSDIDLLVVLTNDDPDLRSSVRRLAARVSLEYELLISVRAVGRSRWEELSRYRFPIYKAIRSKGIPLAPEPA